MIKSKSERILSRERASVLILLFILTGICWGITVDITIPQSAFHLEQTEYGIILKSVRGISPKIGEPDIEYFTIPILLSPGEKATNSIITSCESETLDGKFEIAPTLGFPLDGNFNDITPAAKFSGNKFPKNAVSIASTGNTMGFSFAVLKIYPATYYINDSTLVFNRHFSIELETAPAERIYPIVSTYWADKMRRKIAANFFIDEPKNSPISVSIDNYTPSIANYPIDNKLVSVREISGNRHFPPMQGDAPVDLLILTTDTLLSAAQEYLDETKNGFVTHFATLEQIASIYDGSDDAERMRNFIKDAYVYWGIIAVVLVGDYTQLPVRDIYELDIGGLWSESPSDIYFGALDGDMNSDHDIYFGESPEDDLAPDILFSRLQVRSSSEIEVFAEKHRRYRFNYPREFFNKLLFVGSSIHSSCSDASGPNKKNGILADTGLDTIFSVTKMFTNLSSTGGDILTTADNFVAALDSGYALINHFDHGNQVFISFGMYCGGEGLTLAEIASLENEFYPVLYTFSCDVDRLDTDNIAKYWVSNPDGGGIAMFAHSNTAWSTQAYMDDKMWQVFSNDEPKFTGELFVNWLLDLSGLPYDISILNLSGHPLTPITPFPPEDFDITIDRSDTSLTVTFSPETEHNYLITLASRHRVLYRSLSTSSENTIDFHSHGEDTLWLTVHTLPIRQFALPVHRSEEKHIIPMSAQLDEVWADGDGVPEIGELVQLEIRFENDGSESGSDTFFAQIPFVDYCDTFVINLDADDSITYFSDSIPLISFDDTITGLRAIPLFVENEPFESDTFLLSIAGFSVYPLFINYTDEGDNIPSVGDTGIYTVIFTCDIYGNIFHAIASFSSDYIDFLDDSVSLPDMYSTEYGTVSVHGVLLDTIPQFTVDIHNPFFGKSWDLSIESPSPPESIWAEPQVGKILIYWKPVSGIDKYIVQRADSVSGEYDVITPTPISNSYYIDSDIEILTDYYYRVSSVDSFGNIGLPSDSVHGWAVLPYVEGFPASLPLGVWTVAAPVIFDADGDGCKEIYVADESGFISGYHCDGTTINDTTPILLDSGSQTLRGFWASLAAADIDNDGTMEIVAADRSYPCKIWAIDGFGNVQDGFPVTLNDRILKDFVLNDLNDDGNYEIILFSEYRNLYIINSDGTPYIGGDYLVDSLPECTLYFGASAPAVGDIDGDGSPEIIVGGGTDDDALGYIYAWESDGSRRDDFPITVPNIPWGSPVIANLDDDTTNLEFVIFVVNEGLYAFDNEGNLLSGWPVSLSELGYCDGIRTPSLADFDGDGKSEIVLSTDEKLSVIKSDGTMWDGFPVDVGNVEWSASAIADIDGDSTLEILAPNTNQLLAYELTGEPIITGYPLPCGIDIMTSPTIDDIDGDGLLEIIVPAYDSKLYAWRTFSPADTSLMPWTTHRGNMRRTATLMPSRMNNIVETTKPLKISLSVAPNPFNSTCRMVVSLPNDGALEIFDVMGRNIRRWDIASGNYIVLWDGSDYSKKSLPSGIYYVRLYSESMQSTKRILFLK